MTKLENVNLIFLTAGETPRPNNLITSQVLILADKINSERLFKEVAYFGLVPFKAAIKSLLIGNPLDFNFINKYGINTKIDYTFFLSGGSIEFIIKNLTARNDAKNIIKSLQLEKKTNIIFHCRSYYATHVAIIIKSRLSDNNIRILFDMRSLLPPEFFFTMGKWGELLYGMAKEWERWLLMESDLALMTTRGGIELLRLENPGARIDYIPVTGLDYVHSADTNKMFDMRWQKKKIAYIGTLGYWHSGDITKKLLLYCKKFIEGSDIELITNKSQSSIQDLPTRSIMHSDIANYYEGLLALVIPGKKINSYFESIKFNINFFSAKAAEAVSAGVPLIVNEDITELVQFVKLYRCGIIFRIKDDEITLVNCTQSDLNDRNFWTKITYNTIAISKGFALDATMKKYIGYYEHI